MITIATVRTIVVGIATAASICAANAVPLTGGVAFGGVGILDNPDPTLATQVGVMLAFGAAATGDFSPSIGVGTPIAFTTPLINGVTSGFVWSGGAGPVFTFTATSPITFVGADADSLGITATGIVDDGPGGFDPTPALFGMAVTKTAGSIGAFGSITIPDPTSVPDSGNSLVLLGAGIGLLGFFRRRIVA